MTFQGEEHEIKDFFEWFEVQPAKHLVLTMGNHERYFYKHYPQSLDWIPPTRAHILIDKAVEIEGLKIYGSPWTPQFGFDWAYNACRTYVEAAHYFKPFLGDIWAKIPEDTNILISHGPPMGILDEVMDMFGAGRMINVGCKSLMSKVDSMPKLKAHAFGHIHEWGGRLFQREDGKIFINSSVCNQQYQPVNKPVVLEI
jgi:Icc-related predicted phosphoesterase